MSAFIDPYLYQCTSPPVDGLSPLDLQAYDVYPAKPEF